MRTINHWKNGIETASLLSMENYVKILRFFAAGIASAMLIGEIILHLKNGPSQSFLPVGPYVALAAIPWALARFGPYATANVEAQGRIANGNDLGRQFIVGQIVAAHMLLMVGSCFSVAMAMMSPYRWVPALFVILTVACVELALLGRRRLVWSR
jgi:hypothetical protein